MNKILSKLFSLLKYLLFMLAFALTLVGIIKTYQRLDKTMTESIHIFLPFALILLLFIVNMFVKKAKISDNLLFNFTSIIVFAVIIIVGVRALFDTNMLLYHKYKINYNPMYFSDNLSSIKIMLYTLAISNIFFLLKPLVEDNKEEIVKTEVKKPINVEPLQSKVEDIPVITKLEEKPIEKESVQEVKKEIEEKNVIEEL